MSNPSTEAGAGWRHLLPFGWAPGGYIHPCIDCPERWDEGDKRAIRCRPCAQKAFDKAEAEKAVAAPSPIAVLSAIPGAGEPVAWRVKLLEWTEEVSNTWWVADSYRVERFDGGGFAVRVAQPQSRSFKTTLHGVSFEEAKAAAQADYEQRIMSALTPDTRACPSPVEDKPACLSSEPAGDSQSAPVAAEAGVSEAGKLLPCPFCGVRPTMEPWHGGAPTRVMISCDNHGQGDEYGGCSVGPMVTGEAPEEAVHRWNRRAASPAAPSPVPDMEEVRRYEAFLLEAAKFFKKQAAASGDDMAFWAGVSNSDTCKRIADFLSRLPASGPSREEKRVAPPCAGENHSHPAHDWRRACLNCGVFRGSDLHADIPTSREEVHVATLEQIAGEMRRLRTVRKMGLRPMAQELGISPTTLARVERGEQPDIPTARAILFHAGACACCFQPARALSNQSPAEAQSKGERS